MKYLIACKKNGKNLLRFEDDKGNKVWALTSEAVVTFASKNFKEGDKCGLEYTIDDNEQYNVTRINKEGKSTKKTGSEATKSENTGKPKCIDCGKELKDSKYSKCYECNQKNPSKKTGGSSYSKSPADKEQIKKLAIIRSATVAIQTLTGHISDVGVLAEMLDTLAKKLYQTYDNIDKK